MSNILIKIYFFWTPSLLFFSQNWYKTHDFLNKIDPMQIRMLHCPPEQVECTLFYESMYKFQLRITLLEQVPHMTFEINKKHIYICKEVLNQTEK